MALNILRAVSAAPFVLRQMYFFFFFFFFFFSKCAQQCELFTRAGEITRMSRPYVYNKAGKLCILPEMATTQFSAPEICSLPLYESIPVPYAISVSISVTTLFKMPYSDAAPMELPVWRQIFFCVCEEKRFVAIPYCNIFSQNKATPLLQLSM
jgi:hypothetical protein